MGMQRQLAQVIRAKCFPHERSLLIPDLLSMAFSRQTLKGLVSHRPNAFRVCLAGMTGHPGLSQASSNPGLELANAFGVS